MDIEKIQRELFKELDASEGGPGEVREIYASDAPRRLEHSLLIPDLTADKLLADCRMARSCGIAAVCVPPYYVAETAEALSGSLVAVCAAIGFPSAFLSTEAKVADVRASTNEGATELDIAVDIAAVKSGNWRKAEQDLCAAVDAAKGRAKVKVVFEHGAYSESEKERVLQMARSSGAEYVKVQNMLSGVGARVSELRFVRSVLGDNMKIKIDGGVKTLSKALELFGAGADRIGLTATEKVVDEAMVCCRESTGRY